MFAEAIADPFVKCFVGASRRIRIAECAEILRAQRARRVIQFFVCNTVILISQFSRINCSALSPNNDSTVARDVQDFMLV